MTATGYSEIVSRNALARSHGTEKAFLPFARRVQLRFRPRSPPGSPLPGTNDENRPGFRHNFRRKLLLVGGPERRDLPRWSGLCDFELSVPAQGRLRFRGLRLLSVAFAVVAFAGPISPPRSACDLQWFRLFGQLPGRNKLKGPGSRLLVSPFPEIKFILSCCGVL
jgi:hypothetical protein